MEPSVALGMIEYLPGVPDNHEELGYSKLTLRCCFRIPDAIRLVSDDTNLFVVDASGNIPASLIMNNFGYSLVAELIEKAFASAAFRGEQEYNRVVLGELYSADLLGIAAIFIANNAIDLARTGAGCSNIMIRALQEGELDWVRMLLAQGFENYSESGLIDELEHACAAPDLLLAIGKKFTKEE